MRFTWFVAGIMLMSTATADAQTYPRTGWSAQLQTFSHNTRGTVTIVDADTVRVDDFYYDGGGLDVHFIVAPMNTRDSFINERIVTEPNLLGTAYFGGTLLIDLPAGMSLDGHNAVSLWCIPARAKLDRARSSRRRPSRPL